MKTLKVLIIVTAMFGLLLQSSGMVCVHKEDGKREHVHVFHHVEVDLPSEHVGGVESETCNEHHCDSECQMVSVVFRIFKSVENIDLCPLVTWVGVSVIVCPISVCNNHSLCDSLSPQCPNVLRV